MTAEQLRGLLRALATVARVLETRLADLERTARNRNRRNTPRAR
jgi:hypothetical protein